MSPRLALLWAAVSVLLAFPASAQVTFSTTTYSSNNLWNQNGPPNTQLRVDLNGDGREDFVSQNTGSFNSGCTGSFAVALSTGDGAYAPPVCYTLPAGYAIDFATGDFYGVGTLDVAVSNETGDLYIYRNSGNGTLTLASSLALGAEAGGLVASDVNHDGHIDLVYDIGNQNTGGGGTLLTLLGNGDGTFSAGPTTTFTMADEPAGSLSVGDFDGDGKGDIMVVGQTLYNATVLYGDNTGNFTPGPVLGGPILGVSSASLTWYQGFDVNSDGIMDLIGSPVTYTFCGTGCYPTVTENNYLDLERGQYGRTLSSERIPLQHCPSSANPPQVADFDGDGNADIVLQEDADCKGSAPYTLDFMKGNGDGTFQPEQVIYSTNDSIGNWHVLRASHSSKPDLTVWQYQDVNNVITNPEALVLVNTTTGNFPACTPLDYRPAGISVCGPTSTVGVTSPVNFSFAGTNETPGRGMEIWVDGQKVAENLKQGYSYHDFIDASVPLGNGQHHVDVVSVGWDYSLLVDSFPLTVGDDQCPIPQGGGLNACSP
ncbi:MAG TPA: VCBS repeat-containing protein, partial [Acidobacteriaceae bacterium]|nr:VCBS repeat-containing protein [Acidobacteriaceae bacterium]